jgi:hypothetical protein
MPRSAFETDRGNIRVGKDGVGGRRLASSFSPSAPSKRLVNAMVVVISSELFQHSLQVDGIPDQHVVKKLPSYRPNQPFHDGAPVRSGKRRLPRSRLLLEPGEAEPNRERADRQYG